MAACVFEVGTADTLIDPNTSGAFTPSTGGLLVVFVAAVTTTDATLTITNSQGLTFHLAGYATFDASSDGLFCYVAESFATAVSQTVTVEMPADTSAGTIIAVYDITGMSLAGAAAIRQFASQANQGTGAQNPPDPAFGAAALTTNPVITVVANGTNPAGTTEPATFTLDANLGFITPDCGLACASVNSGFTGTTPTWGNSATPFASMALELDASAVAGGFRSRIAGGLVLGRGSGRIA